MDDYRCVLDGTPALDLARFRRALPAEAKPKRDSSGAVDRDDVLGTVDRFRPHPLFRTSDSDVRRIYPHHRYESKNPLVILWPLLCFEQPSARTLDQRAASNHRQHPGRN